MAGSDVLIKVEGLWKKFCRDLKKSLAYGVVDVIKEVTASENSDLQLRRKEFWSLQDINFELRRGETLGIVGANGAGKSTLLKILHGVIKPSRGYVDVNGSMQALIELGGAFSPMLSGRENIFVSAAVLGMKKADIASKVDEIIDFAELRDFIDAPVATYSTGMRVRLGFSVAMFIEPDILVLDEVLSVGDIGFQTKSLERVANIRQKAGGVVFVSHNVNHLRRLCTKCLLLDHGKVIMIGDPDDVVDQYVRRVSVDNLKGMPGSRAGVLATGGIELLDWGFEQDGKPVREALKRGPFRIWYRVRIDERFTSLGLDIVLFNETLQPITDHIASCREIEGVTGERKICVDYPEMPLAARHYFPYIAVNDQTSLRKIIKFLDPVGFTFEGKLTGRGILASDIQVSVALDESSPVTSWEV